MTACLHHLPLRSVLDLMLRDQGLTWIIQDDVLLITTPEQADEELATKVLDVSDLVVCRDEYDALWDDYDTLIDVIVATIRPTSWDSAGGPGSIQGVSLGGAKVLVVAQTREVHEKIAKLLAAIREFAKKNPNAAPPKHFRHPPKPRPPLPLGGLDSPPAAKPAVKGDDGKKPGGCPFCPPARPRLQSGSTLRSPGGPPPKSKPGPTTMGTRSNSGLRPRIISPNHTRGGDVLPGVFLFNRFSVCLTPSRFLALALSASEGAVSPSSLALWASALSQPEIRIAPVGVNEENRR